MNTYIIIFRKSTSVLNIHQKLRLFLETEKNMDVIQALRAYTSKTIEDEWGVFDQMSEGCARVT